MNKATRNATIKPIVHSQKLAGGTLKIYSDPRQGLVVVDMSSPVLLAAITMDALPATTTAEATGTATRFELYTQDGEQVMEGTVGTSSSDLNINTDRIVEGAFIAITKFDIQE